VNVADTGVQDLSDIADTEEACKERCNDNRACRAFEFNIEEESCNHWLGDAMGIGFSNDEYICNVKQGQEPQSPAAMPTPVSARKETEYFIQFDAYKATRREREVQASAYLAFNMYGKHLVLKN